MSEHELYKPREQCITLLLAVLREIGRIATKGDTLAHISSREYFDIRPEDREPYPSSTTTYEERWRTLFAWARKDALIRGYLVPHTIIDCWHISPDGIEEFLRRQAGFQLGSVDVGQCYLWSYTFKRYMNPAYFASDHDAMRPRFLYEDHLAKFRQQILNSL